MDRRYLYPGIGFANKTGKGDAGFYCIWPEADAHIRQAEPEIINFPVRR